MQSYLKFAVVFALLVAMTTTAFAQDADKKKKKKKEAAQPQAITQMMKKVEALGLTDDQNAKLKAIGSEFAPKFAELNKKMASTLTDDQKKAKAEAVAQAKADGKKGKEAAEAVAAAVKLTDEQKKVDEEVKASMKSLTADLNKAVMAVLTPEQKEKLPGKKKANK